MPVTKTAKRALRVSQVKAVQNKKTLSDLEMAIRAAKKTKSEKTIQRAVSFADRAAKKNSIHTNKANRIKSSLSKLLKTIKPQSKRPSKKVKK